MQQYLTYVSLADITAATSWGSPVDLSQEWSYLGDIKTITLTNEQTLIVEDDDALFDDDDGFWNNVYGNETTGQQTVVDAGGGPIADGTAVEPEWSYSFTTSTGETYKAYAVSEVDSGNGDVLAVHGWAFDDPAPPFGVELTLTSATYTDRVAVAYEAAASPVCFTPGTLIETALGEVPVEQLQAGDLLVTLDHGLQPLKLVLKTVHSFTERNSDHKPILFTAGSLGPRIPRQDLGVSAQHRFLMENQNDHAQFLIAAKTFLVKPGVRRMEGKSSFIYIHLVMEQHEILLANGAPTESFFPGPQAVKSLSGSARCALMELFPALKGGIEQSNFVPARDFLTVQRARNMLSSLVLPACSGEEPADTQCPVFVASADTQADDLRST